MSIKSFFQIFGKSAKKQVTKSYGLWKAEPDKRKIFFTNNFQEIARNRGLTESDATDVYYHGYTSKENMMAKKYNGYEIGIHYFIDPLTLQVVVTSIWKRDRR